MEGNCPTAFPGHNLEKFLWITDGSLLTIFSSLLISQCPEGIYSFKHNAQSVYNFVLQLHLNSWMGNLETQGFCFIASYFVLEQPVIL